MSSPLYKALRSRRTPRPTVFKHYGAWWVVWLGRPALRRTYAEAVDLAACWYAFSVAMSLPEPVREGRS